MSEIVSSEVCKKVLVNFKIREIGIFEKPDACQNMVAMETSSLISNCCHIIFRKSCQVWYRLLQY